MTVTKKPAAKKPAAKKPAAKKPATKKSAAKPATKKPARRSAADKRARDRESDAAAAMWAMCEEHRGRISALESQLARDVFGDDPRAIAAVERSSARGNAPLLRALYARLAAAIDPALRVYFERVVREGLGHASDHPKNTPGALAFFGAALDDWRDLEAWVRDNLGPPESLDRLRRLELAVCAQLLAERSGDEGGVPFLRDECARWVRQANESTTDTALSAPPFLLRRGDTHALRALVTLLETVDPAGPSASTTATLCRLALSSPDHAELPSPLARALAQGISSALARGLGAGAPEERAMLEAAREACAG